MNDSTLTDVQIAHVLAFDERTPEIEDIDFEYYQRPRFGPWNPYWRVFDLASRRLGDGFRRLLIVGCGNGRDALIYSRLGYEVHAFDISPRAIEIARRAAQRFGVLDRLSFTVQAAENLKFDSESFDLVVGVNVLHHMDIPKALGEVHRVLRPGGFAIFKEPLLTPWRTRIRNSRAVTWLIPAGFKSVPQGIRYADVPGEKNLDPTDLALIGNLFANLTIERWHVLTKLAVLTGHRPFLERCDWVLFRMLPFVRRLGDQAVLTFEKPADGRAVPALRGVAASTLA